MTLRATIFGGSGFVGRTIVQRLARQGYVIRIATRNPQHVLLEKTSGTVGQIVPFACQPTDTASVARAVEGADLVINLIGTLYDRGKHGFDETHVQTAERIADAARVAGAARLLHMSALGADANALSKYARSKAAGEVAVRKAFPTVTIFRPSIIFGAGDSFFTRFAHLGQLLHFLPLIGGGRTKFQPVYVGDVADAFINAAADEETSGRTYTLVGPGIYSFKQLFETMLKITGQSVRLVNLPWGLASLQATLMELLPRPMLTRDQVESLKTDNIAPAGAPGLQELSLMPTALEAILPTYLSAWQNGGAFAHITKRTA